MVPRIAPMNRAHTGKPPIRHLPDNAFICEEASDYGIMYDRPTGRSTSARREKKEGHGETVTT